MSGSTLTEVMQQQLELATQMMSTQAATTRLEVTGLPCQFHGFKCAVESLSVTCFCLLSFYNVTFDEVPIAGCLLHG